MEGCRGQEDECERWCWDLDVTGVGVLVTVHCNRVQRALEPSVYLEHSAESLGDRDQTVSDRSAQGKEAYTYLSRPSDIRLLRYGRCEEVPNERDQLPLLVPVTQKRLT